MYIKTIVIEGYKSYGERIVIGPFHPGQNVIVGSNGAGKSNFFSAVQFVLGDEATPMRQEQRQALLHEGSKSRSMTASVEIIFDNTDKRIAIDKNEISLKRVIGVKSNKYILNKTIITKNEVISLMEVAGFSRSNPYYIVQQGKISEVAKTPEARYNLLREIAGVKVFEQRKKESEAIINETKLRIRNIDELLNTINEKLETLEEETRELRMYQEWDKKTRTIEFIIYENEMSHSKTKLASFKAKHSELKNEQTELQSEVETFLDKIKHINYELKKAQREVTNLEEERDNLSKELDKLLTQKELLYFKRNELMQDIALDQLNEASIDKKLHEVNKEIEDAQAKLAIIKPNYEDAVKRAEETIRQLESQEQERQILFAKQGRSAQFQNKEERDAWINKELTAINKQIDEKLVHIKNLQNDIQENEQKSSELEKTRKMIMNDMEKQYGSLSDFKKECIDINKKKEEALAKRKDLHKLEKKLRNDLEYLEEDSKRVNQHLISLFGKGILNGINSVHKVLETFKNRPDMKRETVKYHGLMIEGFSCPQGLYKAVEVTAGNRLFYHVIETTQFGTEILKEMNRQGLPGVVSFMPLDRLRVNNVIYPISKDARPLLGLLELTHRKFDVPVRYLFGRTILARNLEVATEITRDHRFDCVTTDGDQVAAKGWLKGGHFGSSKSPMKLNEDGEKLREAIRSKKEELSALSEEIKNIDNEITLYTSKLQNTDTKYNKAKDTYDKLNIDLNNVKEQLGITKDNQILQNKYLLELSADLSNLETLKRNLENELEQDLNSQLTEADQHQIDALNDSITQLKKKLKNIFKERENLETNKNQYENLLNKNLNCKKDELERQLREIDLENKQLSLQELNDQYEKIERDIKKCEEEKETNETDYKIANIQKQDKLEIMDKLYGELKPKRETFEEKSKELEKLFCNIQILEENRENTRNKMNGLGIIPSTDLYTKYSKLNMKILYKKLDKCRKNLKNLEHVNKKALHQYEISKDQRDNLFKRKDELSRASAKIDELFAFLEEQRHEAVRFTFKQVGKYFQEIFSKIVPTGNAKLFIIKDHSQDGNDSSSTFNSLDFNDKIRGVGINVSFTENTPVLKEYNSLSGGEKALVALTFIFAIQKCDPAPFYLFDEIDQNLDATHRQAVAAMIHELSSEAQFIVTTFRPELLAQANQFYGVRMQNNLSSIYKVSREEALGFLREEEEEEEEVVEENAE